ncbi:MAG: hypothetical protein AB1568_10835 [Thermodesulfobacteriota bacterium]
MSKKIISILAAAAVFSFMAGNAFAVTATNSAGGALTITDTDADLVYTPSPGVLLRVVTSATAFSIASTNDNANDDDQMEYGINSTAAGYYQQTATGGALTAIDSEAYDFSSWTYMGGS